MAAQTRNIIVTVVDDSGNPLQNAAVTLMAGSNPQMLPTDANGQCTFLNLPPGNYRFLIAREGFNTRSLSVTLTAANDLPVKIVMRVVDEETTAAKGKFFFQILTGLQYLFLAALGAVFAYPLYSVFTKTSLDLSKTENARGMITFVVSFGTIAIGLILVMSAAFLGSKDLDKRFGFGKDVFTVLVGVLGTVMGFYYGQTAAAQPTLQISAPQLSAAAPKISSEFTLTATISGGTTPYTYTVTFDPATAISSGPVVGQKSEDGKINQKFTVASDKNLVDKPVTFTIEATDAKGVKGISDKGTFTPSQ